MSLLDSFTTGFGKNAPGKPKRPQTMAEWQTLVEGLPRHERDRLWPGMHKDLNPATEVIDAAEKAKTQLSGPWDSAKSAYAGTFGGAGTAAGAQIQQNQRSVADDLTPLEGVTAEQYIAVKTGPDGADLTDRSDEILAAYPHIEAVWAMFTNVEPVITSGRDSDKHLPNSKHYEGNAIDVRANNISDEIAEKIADTLQQRLGIKYDVDFEQPGKPDEDHVHIEYDPK